MDPQREESAPVHTRSVEQLLAQSIAAYAAGHLDEALRVLDQAPPAGTDSITAVDQARLLTQRGKVLTIQAILDGADLDAAVGVLLEAVQLARTTASATAIADALAELSVAYAQRSRPGADDYPAALNALNQALALYKQTCNYCGLAMTLLQMGRVAAGQDDQTRALVHYQKAHTIAEQYQCILALASIERQLGLHYGRVGDKAAALACFQRALALQEQSGFVLFRPFWLVAIGDVHKDLRNWSAAAECYVQAAEQARTLNLRRISLFVTIAQAALHKEQGHLTAARQSYQQARDLAAALGDSVELTRCEAELETLGPAWPPD